MKKLLTFLASISLTTNLIILAVSCSNETVHFEDLSSVILNKDLGKLDNNDETTVKNALLKQNPTLNINEIKLTIAPVTKEIETNNYTVTVEPIENSAVYSGKVEGITFYNETVHFEDLSSVILNKDLGKLDNNDETTVKNALLKQNPTLNINEIKLTIAPVTKEIETSNYTVTVEPIENSAVYSGKVEGITFYNETVHFEDLSSVILNKDLGKLDNNDETTVKNALLKQNPTLNINEIKLTIAPVTKEIETNNYTVTIEPIEDSAVYSGKVEGITFYNETVHFEDLSSVILNKDLGKLDNNDETTVKNALLKQNPTLNINEIKLTIAPVTKEIETNNYTVTVEPIENSAVYSGKVEGITFYNETVHFEDLSSVILNKDLGKLDNNDETTVKNALLKQNPTLNINEIKLTIAPVTKEIETSNYTVTVEPIENSAVYSGKVEGITFYNETVHFEDLSSVILNKDLGKLDNNDETTVKNALLKQNPTLNINEIKLTIAPVTKEIETNNYTVTIEPIEDSAVYSGKVEGITFYNETVHFEDLSSVILNKDLGKLDNNDETTVKNALLKQNPTLNINEIKLTIAPVTKEIETSNYTVTVEPIENSAVYSGKVEGITFYTEKEIQDNLTYYIDEKTGEELNVAGSAPEGTKEVTHIGYDLNFQAYKMPPTIEKVPNEISQEILSLHSLFEEAESFNQDISSWDTSNITSMSAMFSGAISFNQGLNDWNTSKVTDMSQMFKNANSFNQDLNDWDTSKVTNMSDMFNSYGEFQGKISNWNTSNVVNMSGMFGWLKLFNGDISTKEVEKNNEKYVAWDTSKVTNMSGMFYSAYNFNAKIGNWNTSKVTNMQGMFWGASNFNQEIHTVTVPNGSNPSIIYWDVSNVTDMSNMFRDTEKFEQDISTWNTSNVINMSYMFYDAIKYNRNLSNWDVAKVTNHNQFDTGAKIWEDGFKPIFNV
ncbi:BspA family leucine-rich repeat surface protein [Mesoplasma chauliocola]|nr:BspA family leucine-rich repeat surface protein [Mesoplasma chauliocola]